MELAADHFADHSDPREHIVRQDLFHRSNSRSFYGSMDEKLKELVGENSSEYGKAEHKLADGTTLKVTPFAGDSGIAHWLVWRASHKAPGKSAVYAGIFPADQTKSILTGLGLKLPE